MPQAESRRAGRTDAGLPWPTHCELPSLIEAAEGGHTTIITRPGRPVAALAPLETYRARHRPQSLLPLEGSRRGLWRRNSCRALGKLRDEWSR